MRSSHGTLISSATDLSNHLSCPHLASLNRAVALGKTSRPRTYDDPGADTLRKRGLEHEGRVLDRFREQSLTVGSREATKLMGRDA